MFENTQFLIEDGNMRNYSTVTNGHVDYTFEYDYSSGTPVLKHGNLTLDEYILKNDFKKYELISADAFYERYEQWQLDILLTPAEQITEEQYCDALGTQKRL